jgi:prophage tail gpP-like protein
MATAEAKGALSDLIDAGLDIISASLTMNGAELDIYAGYNGNSQLIFSGVVDTCDLDWDENTYEIKGRDHAASLADGKQTLANINYRNQSVAQIVQQVADQFGFATNITDPGDPPEGCDQVRHLDNDPSNNTVENLRWGTRDENMADRVAHARERRSAF